MIKDVIIGELGRGDQAGVGRLSCPCPWDMEPAQLGGFATVRFRCDNRRKRTLNLRHDLAVSRSSAPRPVLAKAEQSPVEFPTLRPTVASKSGRDRPVVFKAEGGERHHRFPFEGPRDFYRDQAVPRAGLNSSVR